MRGIGFLYASRCDSFKVMFGVGCNAEVVEVVH